MMKKILALLTSICCIAGSTLPVSAGWQYGTYEMCTSEPYVSGFGLRVRSYCGRLYGILVETDGTVLKDTMVSSLDGYTGLATWTAYKNNLPRAANDTFSFSVNVPEENAYMVSMSADLDEKALEERGRALMMEQECVKDVYIVYYEKYSNAIMEGFSLTVVPQSEDMVITEDSIPELLEAGFVFDGKNQYHISKDNNDLANIDDLGVMDHPFLNMMYEETKSLSEMEKFTYFQNYKNEIYDKHADWLSYLGIAISIEEAENPAECTATSIWQDTGDSNSDGKTNAQDASQILMHAALAGAAVEGDVTISETNADVNADGLVNAKDAACVLIYAAAESAGLDLTWADILKQ